MHVIPPLYSQIEENTGVIKMKWFGGMNFIASVAPLPLTEVFRPVALRI